MSSPPSPLATPLPWDLVASDYAAELLPHFERYASQALDLSGVGLGQRVVDVACGPGSLSLLAARRGAEVCALDFSEQMVGRLQARLEPGLSVEVRQGDGQALPYEDDHFDAGFSMFGLMFFPDRVRGLAELRRVVRAGGPVVVSSWKPLSQVPAMEVVFGALREALPGLPVGGATAPLGTPEEIRAETAAAGLSQVEIHERTFGVEYTSVEDFWGVMERTLAPLVLLRHRHGEAWAPLRERIRARVLEGLGDGSVGYEMPAWISVARR